jgi:hypothetical protein
MAGQDPVGSFLGFFVTSGNYNPNTPYWGNAQPTGNLVQDQSGRLVKVKPPAGEHRVCQGLEP